MSIFSLNPTLVTSSTSTLTSSSYCPLPLSVRTCVKPHPINVLCNIVQHIQPTHIHVRTTLTNSGSHGTIPPSGKAPPTRHPCWPGCFLLHLCACSADPHLSSAVPCVPAGKTLVRKGWNPHMGVWSAFTVLSAALVCIKMSQYYRSNGVVSIIYHLSIALL